MQLNKLLQSDCQISSIRSCAWILGFQLVAEFGMVGEPLGQWPIYLVEGDYWERTLKVICDSGFW